MYLLLIFSRYDERSNELINEELGIAYPIIDGIPNMIPQEARMIHKSQATEKPTESWVYKANISLFIFCRHVFLPVYSDCSCATDILVWTVLLGNRGWKLPSRLYECKQRVFLQPAAASYNSCLCFLSPLEVDGNQAV